ncbi:hypothetical protein ACFLSJ_01670 [Verrucomicrobiota bacterium]
MTGVSGSCLPERGSPGGASAVRLLLVLFALSTGCYFFSDNAADPDLWGHLTFGRHTFETGSIERVDRYSYSCPGARWINHEWLSEVLFHAVFSRWGGAGLIALKTAVGLVILALVCGELGRRTGSLFLRLVLIVTSVSAIGYGFATRPQVFTYLFFALSVFVVHRVEQGRDPRWVWALPPAFWAWSNLHGGFVVGLGVLWCYAVITVLRRTVLRRGDEAPRRGLVGHVLGAALVGSAVTLLTPYGTELWLFLAGSLCRSRPYLREWQPASPGLANLNYFALLLLSGLSLWMSDRRRDPFAMTLLAVLAVASLRQNRHIPLFAAAAAILVPAHVESAFGERLGDLERRLGPVFFGVLLLTGSLFFVVKPLYLERTNPLEIEVSPEDYPVGAVAFMKDNRIEGNVFCFFDWAQMCIREFPGDGKVFLDGRYRTVYRDEIIRDYFAVLFGQKPHREYLERFPETDIMLLHVENPLAELVGRDSQWIEVHASGPARLFLKENSRNEDVLRRVAECRFIRREVTGPTYLRPVQH